MRFYSPNAIYNHQGTPCHLSSYEVCTSREEAWAVIDHWKNQFDVICSWVEDRGQRNYCVENILDMNVYVDAFGNKTYPTLRR